MEKKSFFLLLSDISKGEECSYYYDYYSLPVSCWLSGTFFHWSIGWKSIQTNNLSFSCRLFFSLSKRWTWTRKKIFFSPRHINYQTQSGRRWWRSLWQVKIKTTTTMFILQIGFSARLVVLRDTKLLSLNTGRKAIISFRQEYI
jgi:hypothetical protein